MCLAVVLYTVHVILGEGGGICPVCLVVMLFTPGWREHCGYNVGEVYVLSVWLWCL